MEEEPGGQEEQAQGIPRNALFRAFPSESSYGMNMLDYYAGQALTGWIAKNGLPENSDGLASEIWEMAIAMARTRPLEEQRRRTFRPL